MKKSLLTAVAVTAITLLSTEAMATTITGLYSTGVDNTGAVRTVNTNLQDLHYSITAGPNNYNYVADVNRWGSPWLANTSTAAWIMPEFDPNTNGYGSMYTGTYAFTTTFSLADTFDPLTASFTAKVASDNWVTHILLNGFDVGSAPGGLAVWNTITVSDHFVTGLNTLTFDVYNYGTTNFTYGNPSGLIVDIQSSSIDAMTTPSSVPLPATLPLMLSGLGVLGFASRRRKETVG